MGEFSVEPPLDLNLEAGFPITKATELQQAFTRYAAHRRKSPGSPTAPATPGATPPQGPELVRLDAIPEGVKVPTAGPLPEMPVATPLPGPGRFRGSTPPVLVLNTTPRPAATPRLADREPAATPAPLRPTPPLPVATPIPRTGPDGVPLTPFIASNPVPGLPSANSGGWRTYAPGRLPPGRTVNPQGAGELVERGDLGERIYLRGQFIVTASGENKAVLRQQGALADDSGGTPAPGTRIIVEYPNGLVPPGVGSTFARDESRPFEVRQVWRGIDGQININVREVTAP